MSNDIQQRLQAYYDSRFPAEPRPQIGNVVSITSEWKHEMYAFDVTRDSAQNRAREALVLRLYDGDNAHETSAREFYGMKLLHEAGYPVPRVHVLEAAGSSIGKAFVIMERIDGQQYSALIADASDAKASELRTRFCELWRRLHRLDWRRFVDYSLNYETRGPYAFVDHYLAEERATLARHSLPGFLPVVEWLQQRRDDVPCLQPAIVHLDYHANNILVRDDGSFVVIDWTGLHVSDPRIDVACTLLGVGSYGTAERRERLLREYERQAGAKLDHLAWFDVLAALWRLRLVVQLLTGDAAELGLRTDAARMAGQEKDVIKRVAELLLERTGIIVPEVERALA